MCFQFPIRLAKEIGFEEALLLVDNFDSMNIGRQSSSRSALFECFKAALRQCHFILSYHNADEFDACTRSHRATLAEFPLYLEYQSVVDIDGDPTYPAMEVKIVTANDVYKLTAGQFVSAPRYLMEWTVLNEILDTIDRTTDSAKGSDENLARAINQADRLLRIAFRTERPLGDVEDVRRKRAG
jgi:hypothetical protein